MSRVFVLLTRRFPRKSFFTTSLSLMNSAAALVLTVSLVGLAGCDEVRDLPLIATADRVEMGALLVIRARFEAALARIFHANR
jgi:hypothetical protein